jgi:hypothetical protein
MKTPAGSECRYFYGDYFRGRNREECRLLENEWTPNLCKTCPVPGIQRANACENIQLRGKAARKFVNLFQKHVEVTAYCSKTQKFVAEPHVGCGECHPLPPIFNVKS